MYYFVEGEVVINKIEIINEYCNSIIETSLKWYREIFRTAVGEII